MQDRRPDALPVSADRDRELALLETVQAELGEVEAALERVDAGTYGRCQVCGDAIDDGLLAAEPTVRFCPKHRPDRHGGDPAGSHPDSDHLGGAHGASAPARDTPDTPV